MYVCFAYKVLRVRVGSIEKRDQIMAAGGRVFPKLGYHGTTVEDVIREAGVARATFYHYFSDKRELFISVAGAIVGEIVEELKRGIDEITGDPRDAGLETPSTDDFVKQLDGLIQRLFDIFRRNRGMANLFLPEMVAVDKEVFRLYYDFQKRLCDQFERLVDYAIKIGVFAANDSRMAAEFIVSGQLHVASSFTNKAGEYPVEEISSKFADFQLNGLLARPGEDNDRRSDDASSRSQEVVL